MLNILLKVFEKYQKQALTADPFSVTDTTHLADTIRDHILSMIKNGDRKNISEIADLLNLTPSKMARVFKQKFHITLKA